jgi:hypothetical protein
MNAFATNAIWRTTMHRFRHLIRRTTVSLLLLGGSILAPGAVAQATPAGQEPWPARCHWIGTATKPAERLSATQFALSLAVEQVVESSDEPPTGDATVIVNSTYGASFYRPFDIKTGTPLEINGYIRTGGQCVVDTLNVGTLAPGFEGYVRPVAVCPTAGDETIAVYERATVSLGCAVAPMFTAPTALQRFQNGAMLNLKGIYVLQTGPASTGGKPIEGGTWGGTRNTWREPEPASLGLTPPEPGLFEPILGFGKAWREEYDGPDGALGWAVEDEKTTDASWQLFERGIVVVTRPGDGLILYYDGRAWEGRSR